MYVKLEWNARFKSEPNWPPFLNKLINSGIENDEEDLGLVIPRLSLDLLPGVDEGGKRTTLMRGKIYFFF